MSRAMSMLDIDDGIDWIYPNIDMFGLEAQHDYGGSLLSAYPYGNEHL